MTRTIGKMTGIIFLLLRVHSLPQECVAKPLLSKQSCCLENIWGGGVHVETHRQQGNLISLPLVFSLALLFSENKRRLNTSPCYLSVCVTPLILLKLIFGNKNPVPAYSETGILRYRYS